MKKITTFILFGILAFQMNVSAQDFQQKDEYAKKIRSYSKMRNTGIILTVSGAVFIVGGVVLIVDGSKTETNYTTTYGYSYNSGSNDNSTEILLGVLGITVGVFMDTGGIILWSIGGSKKRNYTKKMNAVSLNLNPNLHQSFSLAYRF
jgi:hypothetical protein